MNLSAPLCRLEIHKGNYVIILERLPSKIFPKDMFRLSVNSSAMSVMTTNAEWIRGEFREACRWAGIAPLNADEMADLTLSQGNDAAGEPKHQ